MAVTVETLFTLHLDVDRIDAFTSYRWCDNNGNDFELSWSAGEPMKLAMWNQDGRSVFADRRVSLAGLHSPDMADVWATTFVLHGRQYRFVEEHVHEQLKDAV